MIIEYYMSHSVSIPDKAIDLKNTVKRHSVILIVCQALRSLDHTVPKVLEHPNPLNPFAVLYSLSLAES